METNDKKTKAKARPKLNPTENAAIKRRAHSLAGRAENNKI